MKKKIFQLSSTIFLITIFILDRISKYLALHKLPGRGVYLFSHLKLRIQSNPGIAWGIKIPQSLTIVLATLILIALVYFIKQNLKQKKYLNSFLLGLIFVGAISNLFDRIIHQAVIDFIEIGIWPTFNLADAYISLGAMFYIIFNIKKSPTKINSVGL